MLRKAVGWSAGLVQNLHPECGRQRPRALSEVAFSGEEAMSGVSARRVGFWAAASLAVVGAAYAVVVVVGVSKAGTDSPIVDPILAVMEVLTLIAAPLIVVLMAAIHTKAVAEARLWTAAALGFGVAMAGLTSAVHFIALTAGRQVGAFVLEWPSALYAAELLAWDMFLGMALVCAAAAFRERGEVSAGRALQVTGALCLIGTIGPVIGDMRVQRIGILGYGLGLPVTCVLVARVFSRAEAEGRG